MNKVFSINIEKETINNKNYRKVIYTDSKQQIVLMSLNPGEYIHRETHNGTQFFRIEQGTGIAEIGTIRKKIKLKDGISLSVPPKTLHKIINTSKTQTLKIYTIYSPPQHKPNDIDKRQPADDM
jgi:mannose-6-phosphate isomerase-like protein (cupin superfamily)